MAEVFAAFGTVSAFLQVVDFIAKLASKAYDLSRANQDALREDIGLEKLAREYQSLAEDCSSAVESAKETGQHRQIVRLGEECQKEAQKLLNELESFRIEASSSKIKRIVEGTRVAARVFARQKAIDQQRRQLQELNTLLATRMLQDLWMREGSRMSLSMQNPTIPNAKNVDQVRLVVARNRIHHHILAKLHFKEMNARQQSVEHAWQQTYSWALGSSSHGFSTWLQQGHRIFWISGKAGSGKSTLMKYLCSHERTRRLLLEWSGGRQLIFANFFFWYAGTPLQKSIFGLIRSILYQILYEVPALARVAFPQHFDGDMSTEWTENDLCRGLEAITNNNGGHIAVANKVFCFFIDGLDEYEGDHGNLTQLLKGFEGCPNLKICVSSRPWNAFRSAFARNNPRLRLEDLTKPDIVQYTSDKIRSSIRTHTEFPPSDTGIDDLIGEIADRAEGVFLWVILAVRSVCQGISEGDDVAFLRHRVRSFPSDLEDFFRNILQRVDPIYKSQTNQALKLAWLFAQDGHTDDQPGDDWAVHQTSSATLEGGIWNTLESRASGGSHGSNVRHKGQLKLISSFIDFWLIKQSPQGLKDTSFAYVGPVGEISWHLFDQMMHETKSFLSATCKDLLHLPNTGAEPSHHNQVEFLHRTVYDFLNTPDMQNVIDKHVPEHFKTRRILHLLNLKRLKYLLPDFSRKQREALLQDSTAVSLTSAHPDLCEKYVDQFDRISLHHVQTSTGDRLLSGEMTYFASAEVLATFVAFRQHRYCFSLLNEPLSQDPGLKILHQFASHHAFEVGQVWTAALGESPLNSFPIQHVNDALVEHLLQKSAELTTPFEFPPGSCFGWQILLRRWEFAEPPSYKDSSSRCLEWRRVWDLAKLFLSYGASLHQTFRNGSSNTQPAWIRFTARDHILAHVPRDWINEFMNSDIVEGKIEEIEGSHQQGVQQGKTEAAASQFGASRLQYLKSHGGDLDDPIPLSDGEDENYDGEQ